MRRVAAVGAMAALLAAGRMFAGPPDGAGGGSGAGHSHRSPGGGNVFNVGVPEHDYDVILSRPEKDAVTVSVLAYHDLEGEVIYGTAAGVEAGRTGVKRLQAGVPTAFVLGGLVPDTKYFWRWHGRPAEAGAFTDGETGTFHTARPAGSSFAFTLTADAHLDEHTSAEVYRRTLADIRSEAPDFHIDLGNLFMTDKHATRAEAARQYVAQRYYLDQLGAPLFLALGVHDGEASRYEDGTADSLAVWANGLRRGYFPDPVPDGFYLGDPVPARSGNAREDYFAWTWGDALFVVLNPYGYSLRERGNGDGWGWSLGRTQYDWLGRTLAGSRARYKFVLLHNLLAGDQASRGGVEIAGFNEWGGKNRDGTAGFAQHRPGWPLPVQALLLQNHVTAVFRAHDNFYARQTLDGILYLMVPQPSFAGDDRIRDLKTYGYQQGVFRGNSGHVRVAVAPEHITVSYVKSGAPAGVVADTVTLPARW